MVCEDIQEVGCNRLQFANVEFAALRLAHVERVGPAYCQLTGIGMPIPHEELSEDRSTLVLKKAGVELLCYPSRVLLLKLLKGFTERGLERLFNGIAARFVAYLLFKSTSMLIKQVAKNGVCDSCEEYFSDWHRNLLPVPLFLARQCVG